MKKYDDISKTYEEFSRMRENGLLLLDRVISEFSKESQEAMGNEFKTKNWLSFLGDKYLYKGIECDKLESAGYAYAELIVEELAKQVGFSAAFYDLVRFKNEKGILTRDILEKDNQDMHSLCSILNKDEDVQELDELMENMEDALERQGVLPEDVESIRLEFIKRRIFDLFIMATDTHTENISFVFEVDENGRKRARLAPVFDSESSLCLDHVEGQMELLSREDVSKYSQVYFDTEIEPTLYYGDSWKEQIDYLASLDGGTEFIALCQERLDIDEAIEKVETKIDAPIPKNIRDFVRISFSNRRASIDKVMEEREVGDEYCSQIGEMASRVNSKAFVRILRDVFYGIEPRHEKMIKELE